MPLSDHEQRLLEQMEEALYAEDPKFASHMVGSSDKAAAHTRVIVGIVGAVVGLALVVIALVVFGGTSATIWVGGLGFAVMVAGGAWALTPPRHGRRGLGAVGDDGTVHRTRTRARTKASGRGAAKQTRGGGTRAPGRTQGSFMQRLEQRWDRRHNQY